MDIQNNAFYSMAMGPKSTFRYPDQEANSMPTKQNYTYSTTQYIFPLYPDHPLSAFYECNVPLHTPAAYYSPDHFLDLWYTLYEKLQFAIAIQTT